MKEPKSPPFAVLSLIFGYVLIALAYGWIVWIAFGGKWENAGVFGDAFGTFNALFAGAGFLGVVYAVILQKNQLELQREELRLQREELTCTRKELERSAEAAERQNKHLEEQANEATFFRLLQDLRECMSATGFYFQRNNHTEHGASAFRTMAGFIKPASTINDNDILEHFRQFHPFCRRFWLTAKYASNHIPTRLEDLCSVLSFNEQVVLMFDIRACRFIPNHDMNRSISGVLGASNYESKVFGIFENVPRDYSRLFL